MTDLRARVFPEIELPVSAELIDAGRRAAAETRVGPCAFLEQNAVSCEREYKEAGMRAGRVMRHAQIGYRGLDRSCRAYAEIHERLDRFGCPLDRYGICLDWSMGYPRGERDRRPRGTGLVLDSPEAFARLTAQAPVAPHFGDFVMGMPAAFDNTRAALSAGATSIGNLGQYFTFRLPEWDDDVAATAETVKAIALCAAQPVPVLIHSNLDDGFAALFTDLACALGAVLLEQYIVDDLLGGTVSHCYGHTYSEPLARFAFQRALAGVSAAPGTMIYGNTTLYGEHVAQNYAGLGSYLLIDVLGQMLTPSGHAVNPVPVSEARRIPTVDEVVDAHLFAHRLIERAPGFRTLISTEQADRDAAAITTGAHRFKEAVIRSFDAGGIDVSDPLEMLLAIRRLGPRFLETEYGPGAADPDAPHGRRAVFPAATLTELEHRAGACVDALSADQRGAIAARRLTVCVATTDVHEYGKLLLESVLSRLGVNVMDGGVCADPADLAARIRSGGADVVAVSTYNGIALDYLRSLRSALDGGASAGVPVYIGGKLNQIVESTRSDDLPVDVSEQLRAAGAVPCETIETMLVDLARAPE